MPEGDSVERFRRQLAPMLVGKRIDRAECRWPVVTARLTGKRVVDVEALGKHLLIAFDDDTFIRVHLGMTGTWHRYDPGERWQKSRSLFALLLGTDEDDVVLFHAPEVERLTKKERAHHRALVSLGPDVLKEPFDLDEVLRRARHPERADMELADLLLDQRVACGIGNIYKCESLFALRISPFKRVGAVDDDVIRALYVEAARQMRDSVAGGRAERAVYRQRACGVCRNRISLEEQGERLTWWCATCQP